MHGHWLKGYLRDGKEIEGGGGGSGSGALLVTLSGEKMTANKTFGEIADAMTSGRGAIVIMQLPDDVGVYYCYVSRLVTTPGGCVVEAIFAVNNSTDVMASLNEGANLGDYPEFADGK